MEAKHLNQTLLNTAYGCCVSVTRCEKHCYDFKHCPRYKAAFYVTAINRFALNVVSLGDNFLVYLALCRHFGTISVLWLRVLGYIC